MFNRFSVDSIYIRSVDFHFFAAAFVFFALTVSASATDTPRSGAVVSTGSDGDYHTIQAAIDAAPQDIEGSVYIIDVKPGTYRERVYVQREKRHVVIRGSNASDTTLSFDLNAKTVGPDGLGLGTFRTATLQVDAEDFTVENLTIENRAGAGSQALALRVDGDRVVFRRCRFIGWQDTLFLNRGRQYFEDCTIVGAVDFIFGGAAAFFERSDIVCAGNGYVTAASTPQAQPYGFVFHRSRISGATPEVRTYLGRPWRRYASTLFLDTEMSRVVRPEGWDDWHKLEAHAKVRYGEFASHGPGADTTPSTRVSWAHRLGEAEAAGLTPSAVLGGTDRWDAGLNR